MALEEFLSNANNEQKAKLSACTTKNELAEYLKEEGLVLSDADLELVSGGQGTLNDQVGFLLNKHQNSSGDGEWTPETL